MKVSDAFINKAEGLKDFYTNLGKVRLRKKNANNSVRALENASNIGTSIASRNCSRLLSTTLYLIKVATTDEGVRFVRMGRSLYHDTKIS